MTVNAVAAFSTDYGATFATPLVIGSPLTGQVGGFDIGRTSALSYAAGNGAVYKATTLGGAYASHTTYGTSNPVCVIIPYYRRNSTTVQTTATDADYIVALDVADTGTKTLYFVDGATATKNDITPAAGITFDAANCVTIRYGKEIAVVGKISGVYHLYTSQDAGGTWTDVGAILSVPQYIRCRRNDSRSAPNGQLYLADGNMYYSSHWASVGGVYVRNMPSKPIVAMDTFW